MKKFYSIIALASMMLTSVFSFTSCQKDELPTPQNTQSVQIQSVQTQQSNTTSAVSNATSTSDSKFKVEDTSFVLGTWTAKVSGTDYKLVVSRAVKSDLTYFDEYKATLYVGQKSYEGIFSAAHVAYAGEFHTNAKNSNGNVSARLYNCTFSEKDLTMFKVESIDFGSENIAKNVYFIKH